MHVCHRYANETAPTHVPVDADSDLSNATVPETFGSAVFTGAAATGPNETEVAFAEFEAFFAVTITRTNLFASAASNTTLDAVAFRIVSHPDATFEHRCHL